MNDTGGIKFNLNKKLHPENRIRNACNALKVTLLLRHLIVARASHVIWLTEMHARKSPIRLICELWAGFANERINGIDHLTAHGV